jgi:hypothetical protein
MKTKTRSIAMTIGLTAMLGSAALFADPGDAVATVPFAFQAAGKTLPAGKYTIKRDERTSMTTMRNDADGHSIILLTSALQCHAGAAPKLVFNRGGDGYELSELRLSQAGCTYAALGSKSKRANRERDLAAAVVMLQK